MLTLTQKLRRNCETGYQLASLILLFRRIHVTDGARHSSACLQTGELNETPS